MRRLLPGPASPAWVAAETLGAALAALIGLLFVARIIGPEAAGIGAVASSAFLTADVPISALFGDSLLQRQGLEERHRSSAFWVTMLVAVSGTLALWLLAPLVARATAMPVADMIRALALLLPVSAAGGMLSALALKDRRYRLLALRVLLCQPLAVAAGVGAALAGAGPWAMAAQQAAVTLSVFLLLAWRAGWRPRRLLRRDAMADLWPVAGPQVLAVTVFYGRYRLFIIGLGMLVTEAVVAVTHVAFRLLDVALAAINGAAMRLAAPRLAALQHDRTALAEAYGDLAQLQALIGLPMAAGLAITAPQLIEILMGGPWQAAAEPARLVALAALPIFLVGPAPSLWLALGRTRMNLWMTLIAFAAPLLGLVLLRPQDAGSAAICWALGSVIVPPVQVLLVLRALGRPVSWLLRRQVAPLLGTLVMTLVAMGVAREMAGQPAITALLAIGFAGALAYALVVLPALGFRWPRALQEA
ncbi:oligosaccharide flippase family protein [Paracraurococcus lichenis]|uniref:Oligosaccharide flippase family protein n=1 Tax=Paracraurococcus lichenis TaxID=3064888 RepID=A0ABT9DSV3_9PROT|nr:oligosaccharide flippase family protein [Paracraurococcus sp. LOR1-02]MDO9706963.1 oligosaccharide flippase family protein [Paracraurococcus sp. LOR1-02]